MYLAGYCQFKLTKYRFPEEKAELTKAAVSSACKKIPLDEWNLDKGISTRNVQTYMDGATCAARGYGTTCNTKWANRLSEGPALGWRGAGKLQLLLSAYAHKGLQVILLYGKLDTCVHRQMK